MKEIMQNRGKEIQFLNKLLQVQTKTFKGFNLGQCIRKQKNKEETCDICSCTFATEQGMKTHKKRMHGNINLQKKTIKTIKLSDGISRSDSVKSASDGSRSCSPSPKKINLIKTEEKEAVIEKKKQIEME